MDFAIRLATVDDVDAIEAIYTWYVLNATCTYQEQPSPAGARRAWFDAHGPDQPVWVACERDGSGAARGAVIGWAALSEYNPRSGYRHTREVSIYIDHEHHRRGIGRALMAQLVADARRLGIHAVMAGIDSEQAASIGLHAAFGFEHIGREREVGYKLGGWRDVVWMELLLPRAGDVSAS